MNADGTHSDSPGNDKASRQKGEPWKRTYHLPFGDWTMWREKNERDRMKRPIEIKRNHKIRRDPLPKAALVTK